MTFANRTTAGRLLGRYLKARQVSADRVLGLPRGGVLVAAEIAQTLERPLDVLVVRKIGHPWHREFAVGALAEPDIVVLDPTLLGADAAMHEALKEIIRAERAHLARGCAVFHRDPPPDLCEAAVLLVDDGWATGATAEAAVHAARKQGAARVVAAAPVASGDAVRRLAKVADEVIVLHVDEKFEAVGRYYETFAPVTDDEVLQVLHGRTPFPD
ncbi:MAG: putative phosphoribosyl transferase [Verrucomicrobia bacterium ADurb.Bin118]|nr:MAG: putative phosphoribosyl transferase [Verrucomicrobia bacterium ADurb.Bin118]